MPLRFRSISLRAFRIALLAAAVWLIRSQHSASVGAISIGVERVRDFFPAAVMLDDKPSSDGLVAVKDVEGAILGFVAQTSPASDKIIGYSGPTNSLLAFDAQRALIGVRVLKSADTPDHLAEVIRDRAFFTQFRGLKTGGALEKADAVSGATLTSTAITEGVLRRLGQETESLRFPEEITVDEVKALEPRAASLRAFKATPRTLEVLDQNGARIAMVTRTAPSSDGISGYKGPTDTLMLLDAKGETLRSIRVRKSYETKTYLGYVTGDDYFMRLFDGRAIVHLAKIDFDKEKIEGVSGATITSWSISEGIKQRSAKLMSEARERIAWWKKIRWRWQDTGHVLVILSAFVMAFTRLRGSAVARNAHHALLVVYGGFMVAEMLSQALFVGWARHGVPWRSAPGLVLLGVIALLAPVFSRRQIYCHHICPHGALQQLIMRRMKWQWQPPKWIESMMERIPFVLLLAVLLVAVSAVAFDLNAIEPFDAYLVSVAGMAAIVIAVVGMLFSVITPMAYCRYGCPTGALFKLLRFSGDAERLGKRDWLAIAALGVAAVLAYAR